MTVPCTLCKGEGQILAEKRNRALNEPRYRTVQCPVCKGSGMVAGGPATPREL